MPDTSDYVVLRGGLTVPVAPVLVLLDLERRGFGLERDGDSILVRPYSRLTDHDRAALSAWRPFVLALLDYTAPEVA